MNYIEDDIYSQYHVLGINIIIVLHMKLIIFPQRSSSFITALPGPSLNLASPQDIPLDQNCISGWVPVLAKKIEPAF